MKEAISTTCAGLVLQTRRPYRQIAQENWGLTDDQMAGMHVHHRVPQSQGGGNDPTNLFVCSPWFHAHVWHNHVFWIETQLRAARAGGKVGGPRRLGPNERENKRRAHLGKTIPAAQRKAMSDSQKGRKKPLTTCPHCGLIGGVNTMQRWHFDNCKHKL